MHLGRSVTVVACRVGLAALTRRLARAGYIACVLASKLPRWWTDVAWGLRVVIGRARSTLLTPERRTGECEWEHEGESGKGEAHRTLVATS